jgi:hypothetical protein
MLFQQKKTMTIRIRVLFEKEEMHTIINDKQNTLYTDSSLNQSKGDSHLRIDG